MTFQYQNEMRSEIQIFKKDDATFDIDAMTAANRWVYYISSYTNVAPTEGVPLHQTHTSILRKTLPDPSANNDIVMTNGDDMVIDNTDRSPNSAALAQVQAANRVSSVQSKEGLEMRISTTRYAPFFAPPTEDMLCHPPTSYPPRPTVHPTTETDDNNADTHGKEEGDDSKDNAAVADAVQHAGHGESDEVADSESEERAKETLKEMLVMNNGWMKGTSKEQVDGVNDEYRQFKAVVGETGEDVDEGDPMEE